jgi:hypothetical protein
MATSLLCNRIYLSRSLSALKLLSGTTGILNASRAQTRYASNATATSTEELTPEQLDAVLLEAHCLVWITRL